MENNKTPLAYQISDYDCGTTTLLNAFRYLFNINEISPEIIKYIVQLTLDNTNKNGEIGKGGTSRYSLDFLCEWLNRNSLNKGMKIKCENLHGHDVSIYNTHLQEKINNGAIALLSVYQDCEHYCLLTNLDTEFAYIFDPYHLKSDYYDNDKSVTIINDMPFSYNRKIKKERFEENSKKDFSLVKTENCQILIIEKL